MNLNDLIVTQDSVRNERQIPPMAEFVRSGGLFTQEKMSDFAKNYPDLASKYTPPPLMKISKTEDGVLYLVDGHHRAISIFLSERTELDPSEYVVRDWTYQDYLDIVFLYPDGGWMGWVTPMDLKTEVRWPDISDFKDRVKSVYYEQGQAKAEEYILANKYYYAFPRLVSSVEEIARIQEAYLDHQAEIEQAHIDEINSLKEPL